MITTSYFIDPPSRCGLLRRDVSDVTDAPEGHVFWYEPPDGAAHIHYRSYEAPLESLPSTIHGQRALYRIDNKMFLPLDKLSIASCNVTKNSVRIGSREAKRVLAGAHRAFTNEGLWRAL
jgi:hypothetical protein